MNKALNSIIFLSAIIYCSSCSPNEVGELPELNYKLTHAFQLVVEDHPLRTWSLQAKVIDGEEFLFFGDVKMKDNIKVYNIDAQKWEETIRFEKEGPDGIGSMNGFFVHTMDSIFVVNSFGWQVHLMNGNQKLKTYNTKEGIPVLDQITPFTTNNALKGFVNGKIIFYGFPEIPYEGLDYHSKVSVAQSIDISTGLNTVGIGYPLEYHDHNWPGVITIMNEQAVSQDLIYMSFPLSDSVYVYNSSFNLLKSLDISSINKRETSNFDSQPLDKINGAPGYFEVIGKGAYTDLLIDERNRILFRTISFSKSDETLFSSFSEYRLTSENNLLIYDLDQEKLIGEINFRKEELDRAPMMFTGQKGLYLSKMSEEEEAVDFYLLSWEP
ncbi:DUF4221 domain-containing protein [Algoriphagus sp. AGSA1]|uniref:DUF4221 family protein n=1 Tax=Algoriphagus sp. AGSA1 TaxID=2907213 RepID=UPI001F2A2B8E|nr:DUF4221 family protein [Algoriphagus sp. AGSA1]MCE7056528.1 DUF4221 domain-containing protein [Algoriphagus sp. AGSA1]